MFEGERVCVCGWVRERTTIQQNNIHDKLYMSTVCFVCFMCLSWECMIVDLQKCKPVLGFSTGCPAALQLRPSALVSKSVMILFCYGMW